MEKNKNLLNYNNIKYCQLCGTLATIKYSFMMSFKSNTGKEENYDGFYCIGCFILKKERIFYVPLGVNKNKIEYGIYLSKDDKWITIEYDTIEKYITTLTKEWPYYIM